jgi:hypothetical protein
MTNVTINGNAFDAIVWANQIFGPDTFKVKPSFPNELWTFEFETAKQATLFALKWT